MRSKAEDNPEYPTLWEGAGESLVCIRHSGRVLGRDWRVLDTLGGCWGESGVYLTLWEDAGESLVCIRHSGRVLGRDWCYLKYLRVKKYHSRSNLYHFLGGEESALSKAPLLRH